MSYQVSSFLVDNNELYANIFSNGKEIITLNHEAFDRSLYSEGALTAAKWLNSKKSGLYSMRDLMNFK